jgi:DNA-binding CsgD family transcriptional regulator
MNDRDEKRQKPDTSAHAQHALLSEMKVTVLPMLKILKDMITDNLQAARLVNILEANVGQLVKSYGRSSSLSDVYQQLTPVEAQVASMISRGLSSHDIADALQISPGTVGIHRKHIRKKLGLDSKGINLQSYLQSLSE